MADIFETLRIDSYGSLYIWGQNFEFLSATAWADWQTFRFEWTASELIWERNGVVVRKQANYLGGRQMYFLITMEGASNWAGDPDVTTRWPQEVEIDCVRITD